MMTSTFPFSPQNFIQNKSYLKAVQWLHQHLQTNVPLLYVLLNLGEASSNPLLDFVAWAIEHDQLQPSSSTSPTFPFVAWAKEYQRATSHRKENRSTNGPPSEDSNDKLYEHVDLWLTYWKKQDPQFEGLLNSFGLFPLGGLVHFILWAFEKDILQDIPQGEEQEQRNKGTEAQN